MWTRLCLVSNSPRRVTILYLYAWNSATAMQLLFFLEHPLFYYIGLFTCTGNVVLDMPNCSHFIVVTLESIISKIGSCQKIKRAFWTSRFPWVLLAWHVCDYCYRDIPINV